MKIDGVILRDPDVWCLSAFGCRNLEISDVKLVGLWRYNADGIDICNSQDVVVRNSFVRSFDDAIVLKGLNWGKEGFQDRPVRNVRVHDMVLWCDWGRAIEIGAETSAPEIADVPFRDCDIIRTTHIAMDIQCGDRAVVHDVRYENIRMETDDVCPSPRMQGSRDERYVENPNDEYVPNLLVIVIAKNSYSQDCRSRQCPRHHLRRHFRDRPSRAAVVLQRPGRPAHGPGRHHQNLRFNGKAVNSPAEAKLSIGPHVSDVNFGEVGQRVRK